MCIRDSVKDYLQVPNQGKSNGQWYIEIHRHLVIMPCESRIASTIIRKEDCFLLQSYIQESWQCQSQPLFELCFLRTSVRTLANYVGSSWKKLPIEPENDHDAINELKSESQDEEQEVKDNREEKENNENETTEATENCETKGGRENGKKEDSSEQESQTENAVARNLSGLLDNTLQQNPLPHFFVYVTWVMLVATMATCAFFLILYSMQWGSTTSEEWLASFFSSFAESFFLFEPVKVGTGGCMVFMGGRWRLEK